MTFNEKMDIDSKAVQHSEATNDAELKADLVEMDPNGETVRGLKSRHLQLIALGGTIGTGLFVGSGAVLASCGPAPMLLAYLFISLLVWVIMMDLSEMTCHVPVKGVSVPYLIHRFLCPSLAFASGWNYWLAFSVVNGAEATAATLVIEYWTDRVPTAVWITLILLVSLFLNIVAVSWFGEAEFWFASIKVIAIIGLIILGFILTVGGGPDHDRLGFRYWNDPGAFNAFLVPGSTGRFLAFWHAVIKATFSFILSPEIITMTAGECQAPRRNIPKATRRYIYRLLAFYVLGSLVIGILVPYNSPRLLSAISNGESGAAASPFVLGILNAGIPALNHIINAVILTSAWSSGNAFLFAASRMLYGLAHNSQAPKIFARCNRNGVPYVSVLLSASIGCLAYLNLGANSANVFSWLTSLVTVCGFIAWFVILLTYLRFRKATMNHNIRNQLSFSSPFQPYLTYVAIFFIGLVAITNGFSVFFPGNFSAANFLTSYISFPIFLVAYLGHKFGYKTPLCRPVEDIDLFSGLEEVEAVTAADSPPVPNSVVQKVWYWIV